jgi:hypothetical protein
MSQIMTMTLFTKTFIMKFDNKTCDLRKFTLHYGVMNALGLSSVEVDYPHSHYHNYMVASEGIRIKLSDMDIQSRKTCKPINYNTFQTIGLGLSFQTINEIAAFNSKLNLDFLFSDTKKMQTLTQWVKNSLPQSENFDPMELLVKMSSKDLEKVRSCYTFLPSGVAVDTIERFWTYINFYCTRRSYISNRKPQYFTIDQFKLWNEDFDSLKHYYLLLKVSLSTTGKVNSDILKENANCECCLYKDAANNMLEELERIKSIQDYASFETNLPFAIYNTDQYRALNLWYGYSDFKVFTMFGTAEAKKVEGTPNLWIDTKSEEVLDQLYFIFKNFVNTRGIIIPEPTYGINETSDYKIGFTDLRRPILAQPGFRGMLITDSRIRLKDTPPMVLTKFEGKFMYEGQPADFELYQNYDINPKFYKDHNLSQISRLLFSQDIKIDQEELKRNMLSSKIYRVLMTDGSHGSFGDIRDKYANEGLLGSDRSFTRALVLADKTGLVSYRSSINPAAQDKAVLETQSYKDIPVIDLVNNCSFLRISYNEKKTLEKIVAEDRLDTNDRVIIDRIVSKLGIKPTMSAITIAKTVFGNLNYRDVSKLGADTISDFLYDLLKSALRCVDDKPKRRSPFQLNESKRGILKKLAVLLSFKVKNELVSMFLAKLFARAQNDNPVLFWDLRKSNIYCSLYKPKGKHMQDQYSFINSCLAWLKKSGIGYKKINTIREVIIAKRTYKDQIEDLKEELSEQFEEEAEVINTLFMFADLEKTNYYLEKDSDELEDDLDAISGGDDPENDIERSWEDDLDSANYKIIDTESELNFIENTLKTDYSNLKVRFIEENARYKWLGFGDHYMETDKDGMTWYVAEYPGKSQPPLRMCDLPPTVKVVREAKELVFEEPSQGRVRTKMDQPKLMSLREGEDVFKYQCEILKDNGIVNPESYSKYFFQRGEALDTKSLFYDLEEILNNRILNVKIQLQGSKRARTQALPGFSGSLKDRELIGELSSFFGRHAQQIAAGNHCLTKNAYKTLLSTSRRLFKRCSDNEKALLVSMMAMMKDCIISSTSDDWFLDPLLGIMNELDDKYTDADDSYQEIPRPMSATISYVEVMEYDDEDLS